MGASPRMAVPGPGPAADLPYRVLVTDDSAVVRGILVRTLEANNDIEVVTTVSNGKLAVDTVKRTDIDVVLLDIEMPVMDGLTALDQLMAFDPDLKVIMVSTLTRRNADITMRALEAGASDYLAKPGRAGEIISNEDFRRALIQKVLALGAARRRTGRRRPATGTVRIAPRQPAGPRPHGPVTLRHAGPKAAELLAIGSSTGGPQALLKLLARLHGRIGLPILITQHMPPTFTALLSEHIERHTGWACGEAVDDEPIVGGRVYVAPGGHHLTVRSEGGRHTAHLDSAPPENFCRPSVDVMLRSLTTAYDGRLLTVILTGMGHDGLEGCRKVVAAGGTVLAQDEASSIVWGMPAAVAQAGLCTAVLPLTGLPEFIHAHIRGPKR